MSQFVINLNTYKVITRNFSFTAILRKSREGRFMSKIMQGALGGKRKWFTGPAPTNFSAETLSKGGNEGKRSGNSRRVTVLNKLFMRHITDLMATGDSSAEFLGRGIEINRVSVTPDFKGVNVFWVAKGTENDKVLETLLQKNAGQLRHELSQLRVMGVVPQIHFVKDREFAKLMEVDLRLARADFGEDYVPVEPSYRLKSQLCLNTPLSQDVKEKIELMEKDAMDFHEPPLPPMRMNVLGLNHAVIMHKVLQSMKRSLALHRLNVAKKETPDVTINEDPVRFESQQEQKEVFQEFLRKRRIMLDKAKRVSNKKNLEYEHLRTLQEPLYDSTVFQKFNNADEDYIDEDDVNERNK